MKANIESIKRDIELLYKTFEEQIEEKGYISGNAFFDEAELDKLNSSKPERDKIWSRIESEFKADAFEIARAIQEGFLYLADKGTIRKVTKQFRKAKAKIEKYIEKQNQWLVKKDSYFINYPVQFQILHHLDSPKPHKGSPKKGKTKLIKNLSTLMKKTPPEEKDLAELISEILIHFYAVPSDPRFDRKHL